MRIELTQEAEARRVRAKAAWSVYQSPSLAEVAHKARDMGWKDNKVQVRKEGAVYFIEPFEKECGCPNILKYGDFFD